jgi:CDP-glycerol glycerophosphotransferase (TagB/SpsB family)
MDNIYFYSNQVYQFGHSKSIYDLTGGTFVVNKFNRKIRFKFYLRKYKNPLFPGPRKAPPVIIRDIKSYLDLEGVIISGTNTFVNNNKDKSASIFMGHGAGDKKYGGSFHNLETYDYHFISGPKHLHKIEDVGIKIPDEKLIKIGYPRFDDYVNKKIEKEKYLDYLGVKDRNRKNILYAPTWRWGNGTLNKFAKRFSLELGENYNLIIRPHYHDRKYLISLRLWLLKNNIKNVYLSNPARILQNNSMLDFAISDLMISDTSSIIYEYLITGNPIIIVDNNYKDLHNMPSELNVLDLVDKYNGDDKITIKSIVQRNLLDGTLREKYITLLNNCFYFNDGKSSQRAHDFIKAC